MKSCKGFTSILLAMVMTIGICAGCSPKEETSEENSEKTLKKYYKVSKEE